ncbi:hypothetical protein M413DRAFT_442097 [Hebeloma cylindrosporum]|uniref:Uncharacterized protein n=1 Tax=Hebeloma cylindrosporum TaxID=76867 RepID=A0A0C3CMR8_HEBCY|nr:hypothetical protein M413DRAFT_442097 [Hebeloma cylindrosporum h7]
MRSRPINQPATASLSTSPIRKCLRRGNGKIDSEEVVDKAYEGLTDQIYAPHVSLSISPGPTKYNKPMH